VRHDGENMPVESSRCARRPGQRFLSAAAYIANNSPVLDILVWMWHHPRLLGSRGSRTPQGVIVTPPLNGLT